MPLVSKMIRYPDELQIMGLAYNGDTANQGTQIPSQQTANDCINDICNFLTDLGLIIVPTQSELDLNNIPDLQIYNYTNTNNNLNYMERKNIGFKRFAFNDKYQDTCPLFIELHFSLIKINGKVANYRYNNRFAFNIVLKLINGNNIVLDSFDICSQTYRSYISASTGNVTYYVLKQTKSNSSGFYTDGRLFLNILPDRNITFVRDNANVESNSVYISFYIERNYEYIKFIPITHNNETTSSSELINESLSAFNYYSYNNDNNYTNITDNIFIPFLNKNPNNIENEPAIFKTIDYNTKTNELVNNFNILTTSSTNLSDTLSEYEINIDNENKKYIGINFGSKLKYYIRSKSYSILLRVD